MRTRATFFGVILLLALARPAAAQFSTTMGATMSGAGSNSNTTTTSSFFSQLLGNRSAVPSFNFLSVFPSAPKAYSTMLGRTPAGTTPQVMIMMPSQAATPSFYRRKPAN